MATTAVETASRKFRSLRSSEHYLFIDYATQLYLSVVGVLIIFFHNEHVPHWPLLVGAHAVGIIAIHVLIHAAASTNNRMLDFLRHFYPILLYTALYEETGTLNHMFIATYLDRFFMQLDERLFGFQPSVYFMTALPYLPVSELFYMCYFSYYVMIAGIGLALYFQDYRRFFHYVSIISFVSYVCYLTYIFLPVTGPLVFRSQIPGFPGQEKLPFYPLAYPSAIQAGPFFRIMQVIYRHCEIHGAAFPSSHVAVAISTLYFSWLYLPRIRYPHLVVVVMMCLSTVYCGYHYAIDVLAGVAVAGFLLPVGEFLYRKWRHSAVTPAQGGCQGRSGGKEGGP